jgi:hypothetical protein
VIGPIDFFISKYNRPFYLNFSCTGKKMDMEADFHFESISSGTRVNMAVGVQPKGLMKLFAPMMKGQMKKGLALRVDILKKKLESQ